MMHHIKIAIIFSSLFISSISLANDSVTFQKCIKQLGGSASLGSSCYIDEANRYKAESDKIFKKLYVKIPKKDKNSLTLYRSSIVNQLKICDLQYSAYYQWGKDKISNATVADILAGECVYKTRKQEYQNLKSLICIPDDSCSK